MVALQNIKKSVKVRDVVERNEELKVVNSNIWGAALGPKKIVSASRDGNLDSQ
jgi:hypothetical protein